MSNVAHWKAFHAAANRSLQGGKVIKCEVPLSFPNLLKFNYVPIFTAIVLLICHISFTKMFEQMTDNLLALSQSLFSISVDTFEVTLSYS